MRIFPKYDAKERVQETKDWVWSLVVFGVLAVLGLGVFLLSADAAFVAGDSIWSGIRWICFLIGAISAYLVLQSIIGVLIAATIGPERFLVLFLVVMVIAGLVTWLAG